MAVMMLRHTTPRVTPGTCYGRTDLDVADSFEHEVQQILSALPDFAAIVSSPLQRCRKLADRVAAHARLDVQIDARLIEMDFGQWEGIAWNAIPRPELDHWASDFLHARPHGGETVGELKARVDAALAEIWSRATPTLAVTHAGVIRAALARGRGASHYQTDVKFGELIRLPEPGKDLA